MTLVVKCNSVSDLLDAFRNQLPSYHVFYPASDFKGIDRFYLLEEYNQEDIQKNEDNIYNTLFQNQPVLFPPKNFLVPETEHYLRFKRYQDSIEFNPEKIEEKSLIIVGMKACDVLSFEILDQVFLEEPEDPRYKKRRKNTVVISTPCEEESIYCSCSKFGINKSYPKGADIHLIKSQDDKKNKSIYLQAISDIGTTLLQDITEACVGEQIATSVGKTKPNQSTTDHHKTEDTISLEETKKVMEELSDSPIWDNLAMICLNCGICTYYCPTCHCFDIQDYYRQGEGRRYRKWDSCMFYQYSEMAGGHNPRMEKKDRLKNRFFHKLNYLPKTQQVLGCVGCGRCVKHCPVGISINTVMDKLEKIGGNENE